jgi:homoserine kinase
MGSSAALALAAAAAAGARNPLTVAARFEGHADNAAASVMGGLVVSSAVNGAIRTARLALDPALTFVLVVPDRTLSTAKARQVLPDTVSRQDAAFNLGRMGLLVAGLADHRLLSPEATEDRLHQPYRSALFPEAPTLLDALVAAGALASCWSGAGSSLLGICTEPQGVAVRDAAERALGSVGIPGRVLVLRPDLEGLVTGETARLPSVDDVDGVSPNPGPERR